MPSLGFSSFSGMMLSTRILAVGAYVDLPNGTSVYSGTDRGLVDVVMGADRVSPRDLGNVKIRTWVGMSSVKPDEDRIRRIEARLEC